MSTQHFLAWVLTISALVQVCAAVVAFRLIRVTGRFSAWVLLSVALACMAVRRATVLGELWAGRSGGSVPSEIIGLVISVLMLCGILLIGRLFRSIRDTAEQLDSSARRLQEASLSGKVALWDWNIAAGTVEWSQAVDEMLGFPPHGFPRSYRAWESRLHPDDLANVQQAIRSNFETNAPYDVVYRIHRADGTWAWWHEVGHVTRDPNGAPVSMAGSSVDITDRKQREAEYASILQTAMDGFFSASARTGRLLDVNDAYCTLVGYTRAELLSLRVADLELNESPGELAAHMQRIIRAGGERFETRHRCKDGSAVDLAVSAQYLASSNRVCVFVSNITARKRDENALHVRIAEAERFNRLATARERRIVELKEQLNGCAREQGRPPPFPTPEALEPPPAEAALPPALPAPSLATLFDREQLQALLGNLSSVVGVSMAMVDTQGEVFVGANWQPICTAFHRISERAWVRCVESDTVLAARLERGKACTVFRCLNGLSMAASPIVVGGRTLGSLFLSQFLREPPDLEGFRRQAAELGFDEAAYLAALARVPVLPPERLQPLTEFLVTAATALSRIGADRLAAQQREADLERVSGELRRQREAALNLAQDAIEARRSQEASEELLRLNRDMLARILDTIPQAVFWKDRQSVCLGCNRVFAETFGFASPDDVVGKSDFELFPSRADAEAYRADDHEVMENNRPKRHIIESGQRRNGERFWADTTKLPLVDRAGQVYGVLGVFEDISARKLAEERLREQDERLRFALDTVVGAGEWSLDLRTFQAQRSEQHGRIFGYEPPLPPWSFEALLQHIVPEDRARVEAHIRQVMRDALDVDFECRITRRDGEGRWIWARGRHVRDAQGLPVRISGVVIDITPRKQAEQALRDSEERMQLALVASQDAVWDWCPPEKRLYWSARFQEMLGCPPGEPEASEQALQALLHPDDLAAVREMVSQCMDGQRNDSRLEFRVRSRGGAWLWVLSRGRVLARGAHGEILRMAGTFSDITLRKQNEETLQRQLLELQRWQSVMLGREQRDMELKREVNQLLERLREPPRYDSVEPDSQA
jgi:PAS domain S-box-containing protein